MEECSAVIVYAGGIVVAIFALIGVINFFEASLEALRERRQAKKATQIAPTLYVIEDSEEASLPFKEDDKVWIEEELKKLC